MDYERDRELRITSPHTTTLAIFIVSVSNCFKQSSLSIYSKTQLDSTPLHPYSDFIWDSAKSPWSYDGAADINREEADTTKVTC